MAVNSKQKGARGEREAVKFLKSLGYPDAMRTAQYNGKGESDVVCPKTLPGLTIEVKYGYPNVQFSVGSSLLKDACDQAYQDSGCSGPWVVLWRNRGSTIWRLTCELLGMTVTVAGGDIAEMLEEWEADPESHKGEAK